MDEKFSKIHFKIINELGTLLSHLGADSGSMANVMSWGDTQDSEATYQNLKDWNEKFAKKKE